MNGFIGVLLVVLMILVYSVHGIFLKKFNEFYPSDPKDSSLSYTVILGLIVAFISFAVSGFRFKFSLDCLILGIICGILITSYNVFLSKSIESGPYSVATIFQLSGGILVPLFSTMVAFGEIPTWVQFVGIAIMLVAFVLICFNFKEKSQVSKVFYISALLVFLSNGFASFVMALADRVEEGAYSKEFVIITYLVASLSAFIILTVNKKGKPFVSLRQTPKSLLFATLGALSIAGGINLLMVCLSYVSESVLFTVQNGGVLVLSALFSMIIFKEKISLQKWIGIAIAGVSMALLSM